jgi:Uma2 family endonuclease
MAEPLKMLFTVSEYHAMAEAGILKEDDRVELIEGVIWRMPPIGSSHAGGVNRLNALFTSLLGRRAVVSVQNPAFLSDFSEPQPDLLILRFRDDFYAGEHPRPEDVFLLIEVADSSLDFDRRIKAGLYARHLIPEFWLRDLRNETLVVHRDPAPQGYRDVKTLRRGESLSPLAFPDLVIEVSALLG